MSADVPLSTATGSTPYTLDRPAGRTGAILGALAAVAASIGLAWWLGADEGGATLASQPTPVTAAPPRPFANPAVDESQVRRAYEQFQALYADAGMDGLLQSSQTCTTALRDDRRILDFCLALDMYASTLAPRRGDQEAWFRTARERRLALARDALADPAGAPARVAELERLTRIAAPAAPATRVRPKRAPAVESPRATASRSAALKRQSVRRVASVRSRPAPRSRCDTATAAGRVLCTSPALQRADREMLRAYDRALAAGIDEHLLNRQQARWRRAVNVAGGDREALARLYQRRIWELNADARARE